MVSAVESVVGHVHLECVSERSSSAGSYISVTVGPVWVQDADQVGVGSHACLHASHQPHAGHVGHCMKARGLTSGLTACVSDRCLQLHANSMLRGPCTCTIADTCCLCLALQVIAIYSAMKKADDRLKWLI